MAVYQLENRHDSGSESIRDNDEGAEEMFEFYQPFCHTLAFFKDFAGVIQKGFPMFFLPTVFALKMRKDELNVSAALKYIGNC